MFEPREEESFKKVFNSTIRVFIVLIIFFAIGEVFLNGHGERFLNSLGFNKEKSENILARALPTSAPQALASIKSSVSLLSKIEKAEDEHPKAPEPAPLVSAKAYIIADIDSGVVYLEKNADDVRSIASLSKLVTALVASTSVKSNPTIVVDKNALNTRGNTAHLALGESVALKDMYYPLLLNSANDAARAIADYYGEELFSTLMNKEARGVGMIHSNFVEPSGLSAENVSTARDLFLLAQYIEKQKPFIFGITRIEEKIIHSKTPTNNDKVVRYQNIHQLRNIEGFVGGKNGLTTAAGKTLLSLFKIKDSKGAPHTIAFIVLGSNDSTRDSLNLLSWFKRSF